MLILIEICKGHYRSDRKRVSILLADNSLIVLWRITDVDIRYFEIDKKQNAA